MPNGLSGKLIFSSGKQNDYDVWMLDFDSGELRQLTHGRCWNDKPRWSPDGRAVVFVSNAAGPSDIYKVTVADGHITPLVKNGKWNDSPAFSPDGKRLGYVSNASGNNDLWIADADGQNPRQVTTYHGDDSSFAWSPDGKTVLYSSESGGSADIWRLDLASGDKQRLTTNPGLDFHPTPSPDGQLIAFVSNRANDPAADPAEWKDRDLDLWLMTRDGQHQVRLTENQGSDRCVAWSPDGRHLMYAASGGSDLVERLRIVDVAALRAAYESDDAFAIQRAATALRFGSLKLDRRALEAEIDARRHPYFLTRFLPDFLVRPLYGEGYFGMERYPDWIAGSAPARKLSNLAAQHAG